MKKSVLIPLAFATLGVIAAPAFAADSAGGDNAQNYQEQRKNMDNPQQIEKERKAHAKALKKAKMHAHGANKAPNYNQERRNLDSQTHIQKKYKEHEETMKKARKDGQHADNAPNYDKERQNIDSQQHIQKEYQKTMKKQGDVDE